MARLFSVRINSENKEYTRVDKLKGTRKRPILYSALCYIDKGLRAIIPGDFIEFYLQEGLKRPKNLSGKLAQSLIQSTTTALANYYSLKN